MTNNMPTRREIVSVFKIASHCAFDCTDFTHDGNDYILQRAGEKTTMDTFMNVMRFIYLYAKYWDRVTKSVLCNEQRTAILIKLVSLHISNPDGYLLWRQEFNPVYATLRWTLGRPGRFEMGKINNNTSTFIKTAPIRSDSLIITAPVRKP